MHRSDGPAIEHINGDEEWWVENKCHRLDGPAIKWKDKNYWFINNEEIQMQNYSQAVNDFLASVKEF